MKKILSIILALIITLSLSGCSGEYALHRRGTYFTNGEKYTYEIHSFKEIRSLGSTTVTFGELQGYYAYPLHIYRRYSSVSYNITHGEGELSVSIKEANKELTLPNGSFDYSMTNDGYLLIIFKSENCKNIEAEFNFIE